MKTKFIAFIGLLFIVHTSFAQRMEYRKIGLDSLIVITPIVDAAKRDNNDSNAFNAELSSKISKMLFAVIREKLPHTRYQQVSHLETLSQKEYINITHNYLAWASSKKAKKFFDAPASLIQPSGRYTLHIAFSGYFGPSSDNGIFGNLFILDNEMKKIIYCDRLSRSFTEITDQKAVSKATIALIDRYLAYKAIQPNQP
ncbi:MAG: hypothetical protein EOO96_02755 [Pedobacter sp.]|nr:MAG: hypothetical protein EOO96_02755 [Pedobacter sp.]